MLPGFQGQFLIIMHGAILNHSALAMCNLYLGGSVSRPLKSHKRIITCVHVLCAGFTGPETFSASSSACRVVSQPLEPETALLQGPPT